MKEDLLKDQDIKNLDKLICLSFLIGVCVLAWDFHPSTDAIVLGILLIVIGLLGLIGRLADLCMKQQLKIDELTK